MGKKQGKDGPKRKSIKFDVNADIDLTRYLKVYAVQCLNDGSLPCAWLLNAMKNGIEHRKYLRKVKRVKLLLQNFTLNYYLQQCYK